MSEERVPVPLRCDSCGEIIYNDQAWDEYGGDYDCSDKPWHTACRERHEAEEIDSRKRHWAYIHELRARPWESLSFEEASTLSMAHSADSLVEKICATGPEYFGPGNKDGES